MSENTAAEEPDIPLQLQVFPDGRFILIWGPATPEELPQLIAAISSELFATETPKLIERARQKYKAGQN